ncbi:MAG: hypothetical protein SFU86_20290 [Pirellulaceae bacterium]|nr:hypothetical protein [Pirellulaceae bacterium]
MNITLQLRPCDAPQRPAAAWLVPGNDPQAWLAELLAWEVSLAEAALWPLPRIGLLVTLPAGIQPRAATALPYGRVAERLLAPVEGALDPPLAPREIAALLPAEGALLVWHPGVGLLRLAADGELSVAHLLAPPTPSGHRWDAAQPGQAQNDRIISLEPEAPLSLGQVLSGGRDDIGTQPLRGSELPPAPHEPAGGALGAAMNQAGLAAAAWASQAAASVAGAAGSVGSAVASALGSLLGSGGASGASAGGKQPASARPKTARGKSWLDRLKEWAQARREAAQRNLDQLRNRQVERLLNLLRSSPDEGLRFALPMKSGEHRGLAPPSARLGERRVDFNLSNLGGGGPADIWDLPGELRHRLLQQYRELANREIALGRHRRAAYIFAELLGDLPAAAATLADGGHYREAAVLFKDRLKLPLRAAECLQKGGLWTEAIALFEELKQWETVGDLYRQLAREDEAQRAYRLLVGDRVAANNYLGAAQLLERKLHDAGEAYEVLLQGWSHAQPACLDAAFDLLARSGDHERARELVGRLAPGDVPQRGEMSSVALANVATNYPDEEVRRQAADASRQHIGTLLPLALADQRGRLLRTLTSLVPADRLLQRDAFRYEAQIGESERKLRGAAPRGRAEKLRRVAVFQLPQALWKTAISTPEMLLAAGIHRGELTIVRSDWQGDWRQSAAGWCALRAEEQRRPILLAARRHRLPGVLVHVTAEIPSRSIDLPPIGQSPFTIAPGPAAGDLLGLVYDESDSLVTARVLRPGLVSVAIFSVLNDALLGSPAITHAGIEHNPSEPHPFFCRRSSLYLGVGNTLISHRQTPEATALHAPIIALTGSHSAAEPVIVATCEQGVVLVWGESARDEETSFALDLERPVAGLSRGGILAVATRDVVEVARLRDKRVLPLGTLPGPGVEPIAVLPLPAPAQFAIVSITGQVQVYEAKT